MLDRLTCLFQGHRLLYRASVVGSMDKVHLFECERCGSQQWALRPRDDRAAPKGEVA